MKLQPRANKNMKRVHTARSHKPPRCTCGHRHGRWDEDVWRCRICHNEYLVNGPDNARSWRR